MSPYRSILRPGTLALLVTSLFATADVSAQLLGTAASYGVLGGSTVTNTGSTVITGDLGVSPGTAITGFAAIDGGPGVFTGVVNQGNLAAAQAHADLTTAYLALAALTFNSDLSGMNLGGRTLTPGVYRFTSSAQLTGVLTLDTLGDANARFVFQIGTTLTTASNAQVNLINAAGGLGGASGGLFWQVGRSATLGTSTVFAGDILALESVTLTTGASIDDGSALAINGAVTLDSNRINTGPRFTAVPEPGTYGALGAGALLLAVAWRRVARRSRERQRVEARPLAGARSY